MDNTVQQPASNSYNRTGFQRLALIGVLLLASAVISLLRTDAAGDYPDELNFGALANLATLYPEVGHDDDTIQSMENNLHASATWASLREQEPSGTK